MPAGRSIETHDFEEVLMTRKILIAAALAALGAVSLSGCVVVPARPAYAYEAAPIVTVAPPAPEVEYYGEPPVYGQIWIGGYWNWVGSRHVWVGGHWESPRPGHYWVPHTWVQVHGGWRLNEGHWEKHR
jgi:hypothetical protein